MNYPEDYIIECYKSIEKSRLFKGLTEAIKAGLTANPYVQNDVVKMWKEQCGINLPLLYVASIVLYKWGVAHGCNNYLFATRDCVHWFRIFKRMYPEVQSKYFDCSRNMLTRATETDNPYYDKYVESCLSGSTPEQTVFVDIHGTCVRILKYFKKRYDSSPYTFLLSTSYLHYADFPGISREHYESGKLISLVFDTRGTPIETLNYDSQGTLQNYDSSGPVRDEPEYSLGYLEAYHVAIGYLLKKIKPVDLESVGKMDFSVLCRIVDVYFKALTEHKPIICQFIRQPCKH
jgi:hypothetical protein